MKRTYRVQVSKMYAGGGYTATVWEPQPKLFVEGPARHGTITSFDDTPGWWGRVGTRDLPEWINRIPGMGHPTMYERIRLVQRYQHQQARIAQLVMAKSGLVPPEAKFDYGWAEATWTGDNA